MESRKIGLTFTEIRTYIVVISVKHNNNDDNSKNYV